MKRKQPIVAIDGPAASGKSTVGKILASELGYLYIDTGALYRAVALKAIKDGISLTDGPSLGKMVNRMRLNPHRGGKGMKMLLDGVDITDDLKGEEVGYAASTVSAQKEVRSALLGLQRDLGKDGGIVMDGRDIGTVIFPDAEAKFFLDASCEERGRRRHLEMKAAGQESSLEKIIEDIKKRDRQDTSRDHAPLAKAPDAVTIMTTDASPEEVVAIMKDHLRKLPG